MHTDAAVDLRKLGTKEVSTFHQRALNQNLLTEMGGGGRELIVG